MHSTKRKTTEQFIEEAKKVHDIKYDYTKVDYKNQLTKVCIICPEHGEFWQRPKQHLKGEGCPLCGKKKGGEKISKSSKHIKQRGKAYTQEEFITILKNIYGDKYDYSKVKYTNTKSKITLICPKHGEFVKLVSDLISKKTGCQYCNQEKKQKFFALSKDEFIKRANEIHHNKYTYDNVKYINNATKVLITCPKHGDFLCTPANHLKGRGCPICKSEGFVYEERLYNFLRTFIDEKDILRQCKFDWLSNNKSVDFYIPKYKIAIEHQGSQHFYKMRYYTKEINEKELQHRIQNDKDKLKECNENGINILYFSYEIKRTPRKWFYRLIVNENELKNKILEIINKNKNE